MPRSRASTGDGSLDAWSPEPQSLSRTSSVCSRPQTWNLRKLGDFMEGRITQQPTIKRWDGAARVCYEWDSLRRDPELWFNDGNCLVHLYEKGTSRRGPAFKVPFTTLLDSQCHPFLERFLVIDGRTHPALARSNHADLDFWKQVGNLPRIELYVPAPPTWDKNQAFRYHLATRNFFAWIFRRSAVGDHLGSSLVGLLNSMHEFRTAGEDHLQDLLDYLDEEGYLNLTHQPNNALALLHFAEFFHLRDLYVNAVAHCAGLSDRLFLSSEYQHISSVSRKLIRRAKAEMDARLSHNGAMLRAFLEDELSEAHLGLPVGARAHLERFRTCLLTFYTTKFGYYPPCPMDSRGAVFEPEIYRTMHTDFEALYRYLVDESFTPSGSVPPLARGGICTMQSVHGFDLRQKYVSLPHPLPLLPQVAEPTRSSRRLSWLSRSEKPDPDRCQATHAALVKATNGADSGILANSLVQEYRRFEEETTCSPLKVDRHEKVSAVDARKTRWILVYATYQTLRNCLPPPEVRETVDVPYNVAISTATLPPWKEEQRISSLVRSQTDMILARNPSVSTRSSGWVDTPPASAPALTPEIRPDVDYFAIRHRREQSADADPSAPLSKTVHFNAVPSLRPLSLSKCLAGGVNPLRRSLSMFKPRQVEEGVSDAASKRLSYHEIVVQGYGNGTNDVIIGAATPGMMPRPASEAAVRAESPFSSASSTSHASQASARASKNSSVSASTTDSPITPYSRRSWASRRSSIDSCQNLVGTAHADGAPPARPRTTYIPSPSASTPTPTGRCTTPSPRPRRQRPDSMCLERGPEAAVVRPGPPQRTTSFASCYTRASGPRPGDATRTPSTASSASGRFARAASVYSLGSSVLALRDANPFSPAAAVESELQPRPLRLGGLGDQGAAAVPAGGNLLYAGYTGHARLPSDPDAWLSEEGMSEWEMFRDVGGLREFHVEGYA